MNLSKEQIKDIDNHLKKNGIKYWDLRIEMIDHLVTDIERNASSNDFKSELTASLKRIGWLGNLNNKNIEGWKNVNRKYRKMYHQGFISFFKKTKNILLFSVCFMLYYWLSERLILKSFNKLSHILIFVPMLFILFESIKVWIKKYGKSVNLDYGIMYSMMAVLILQWIPNLFSDATEDTQKIIWFVLMPIYYVATYSGYTVFKEALKRVKDLRKELL